MKRFMVFLVVVASFVSFASVGAIEGKTIYAKALVEHECNSTEWHFVITQVEAEEFAPPSIIVHWTNGNEEVVPLDKFTGGTAHYATTSNLDSTVEWASAEIYSDWEGQFNLSHGPCGEPPQENTLTVTPFVDCDGWSLTIVASEGADVVATPGTAGDWSQSQSVDVQVTATWTEGEPLELVWTDTLEKPEDCDEPIENYIRITPSADCEGWSITVDASPGAVIVPNPGYSGPWGDQTSVVVTVDATWTEGEPLFISQQVTIYKPEDCEEPGENHLVVTPTVDCDGWSVSVDASPGAEVSVEPGESGVWNGDTSVLVSVTATWQEGEPPVLVWEEPLTKPENCDRPKPEPTPTKPPEWHDDPGVCDVTGLTPNVSGQLYWLDPNGQYQLAANGKIFTVDGNGNLTMYKGAGAGTYAFVVDGKSAFEFTMPGCLPPALAPTPVPATGTGGPSLTNPMTSLGLLAMTVILFGSFGLFFAFRRR